MLFDRDGTLVRDVPYNGDPERVVPMPGARDALDRLRAAGLRLAVVSNQSGIARGLVSATDVQRVNARIEELLGPFDGWYVCPHGPGERCGCRKPAPGLVHAAARDLGTAAQRCVLVGDIGADMVAARAAGGTGLLVPTDASLKPKGCAPSSASVVVSAVVDSVRRPRPSAPWSACSRWAATVLKPARLPEPFIAASDVAIGGLWVVPPPNR